MRCKHKRINHEIVDEREREPSSSRDIATIEKCYIFLPACQKEPKSTHNKVRKRSRAKVIAAVFNFEMIKCFTNGSARARLSRASPEFDIFFYLCVSARGATCSCKQQKRVQPNSIGFVVCAGIAVFCCQYAAQVFSAQFFLLYASALISTG